ncbi:MULTISPECIES: hypothetical protein [Enterobacterales]|uniref:hypothetical protein n=1 Tax=Enterobacterales TaxID=91347 RepID=UPI002EDA5369
MGGRTKNKENQFIDFRLLTTKKEKPRFFLLCQQSEGPACAGPFSLNVAGRVIYSYLNRIFLYAHG